MNLTDPIADMLTRIRNANSVNKATVSMPSSCLLYTSLAHGKADERMAVNR